MIYVVSKYFHKPTANDVYIGRGSVLGNEYTSIKGKITKAQFIVDTPEESVACYERDLLKKLAAGDASICAQMNNLYKRALQGDLYLICYCKRPDNPGRPCHGDSIKRVLEEKLTQRGFAACLLPFEKLPSQSGASPIKGLHYVPGLLSPAEHDALVGLIDGQPWLDDLRRRVQHYGYKYDDKARRIDASMRIADLPDWLKVLAVRLSQRGFFEQLPDQVSINEYLPGQGIDDHVDCPPCFADTIATLSLGSPCVMNFTCKDDVDEIFPLLLEPSSVVVLKDEARYDWMHGIDAVKYDDYQDRQIKRSRRISLTFRKVLLSQERA